MKERILQFLQSENKTSAQFAEEIGVQPSGISHILSGRNNPSLDFVLKMLEQYPFLSTEWLLFGKGSMYRDQAMQDLFEEVPLTGEEKGNANLREPVGQRKMVAEGEKAGKKSIMPERNVEKIVWFFTDNSFKEYLPGEE